MTILFDSVALNILTSAITDFDGLTNKELHDIIETYNHINKVGITIDNYMFAQMVESHWLEIIETLLQRLS